MASRARLVPLALFLSLVCGSPLAGRMPQAAGPEIYKDPSRPVSDRVNDLVSRMTLDEKVSQLVNGAAAIPRLGVPEYDWWNEALHGVARAGVATVFPQAIALAATFDEPLMHQVATTISTEARAKYNSFTAEGRRARYQGLTFWSPNINIFRDPRWGRGMETYGEDPYLAGRLAVAFVKGLQGDDPRYLKTVATPKHYAVHSGPESERHVFDARVDDRDLRDTYLPQFEMAVREGGAFSVMCAYNRFRGEPACASSTLLGQILRQEWGFGGYVVSDCDSIDDIYRTHKMVATPEEASAMAVKAGCDLDCGRTYKSLVQAVQKGLIKESEIDESLKRLFTARFRLGMFDPPAMVPWSGLTVADVGRPEARQLAFTAARESIVLLKNEDGLLPLSATRKTIAVIGPNADDVEVLLGNYNGTPAEPVTVLEGLRRGAPTGSTILHAPGSRLADGLPLLDLVPASALSHVDAQGHAAGEAAPAPAAGLKGEYFASADMKGEPAFTRVDSTASFTEWSGSRDPRITDPDNFAVRWTGELTAPASGAYNIGGVGLNEFRIFLDGKSLVTFRSTTQPTKTSRSIDLQAGRRYPIRIEYAHRARQASFQLLWDVPGRDLQRDALAMVRRADVVVMALGLSPRLEGEEMNVAVKGFKGGDRVDLGLPEAQQRLLEAVQSLGKPVVLLLLNGSALSATWADAHVPAIVEAWYPGQAAGTAVADVLFGRHNPAGRLPVTFYRSVEQLPAFGDYRMAGRTYRYFKGDPLYPFGHGLSYTKFAYRNLALPQAVRAADNAEISVDVQNVGGRPGEEVVQVYVTRADAPAPAPVRSLAGFRRVSLAPGESKTVRFTLSPRELSLVAADGQRLNAPGTIEVSAGGKQPGFTGHADATTTSVVTGRFEIRR